MSSDLKGTLKQPFYKIKDFIEYGLVYLSLKEKAEWGKHTVLFYPNKPRPRHVLGRIFSILNYKFTTDISKHAQAKFVVNWEDTTFRTPYPELEKLLKSREIINIHCKDISKKKVDEIFGSVFGYQTMIDPTTFRGICVQKGDINALHNGRTIECPIEKAEPEYIYQKLIHNQTSDQYIEDIRVPIFRDHIPFVYIKKRPIADRFGSKNDSCVITETAQVFSSEEIQNTITFCKKIGLDYGELDILRDRKESRIYIVDVNNTPGGPPNALSKRNQHRALNLLTTAFIQKFVNAPEKKPASARKMVK